MKAIVVASASGTFKWVRPHLGPKNGNAIRASQKEEYRLPEAQLL